MINIEYLEKVALRKLLKVQGLKGRAPLSETNIENFTKNRNRGISSNPEKRDAFENSWVKETDNKANKMREFAKKNEGRFEYKSREEAQRSGSIGAQNTQEKSTQNRNIVKSYNNEFNTNKRYYANNPAKRQQDLNDLKGRLHKQASLKLSPTEKIKKETLKQQADLRTQAITAAADKQMEYNKAVNDLKKQTYRLTHSKLK